MDKPIFMKKREGPKLSSIMIAVAIVVGGAYAGLIAWERYGASILSGAPATPAPVLFSEVEALVDQGALDDARTKLTAFIDRSDNTAVMARALILLARIDSESNNIDAALEALRRAATEYPASAQHQEAAIAYARLLEKVDRFEEAEAMFAEVRDSAPAGIRTPALVGLGRAAGRKGNTAAARDLYRKGAAESPWGSPAWNEAVDALGTANVALIFSQEATDGSEQYIVKRGDSLTSIGMALNTTQGLLTRANGIEATSTLRIDQRLKYTHKDFRIIIERSTCRLYLFDGSGLFKRYTIGLGKEGHETALGAFRIGSKQKNPDWFPAGGGRIPFGDPRNELGTRWLPMEPEHEDLPRDLGIHGTFENDSIGLYSSSGCARLLNAEVEELYDLVVRATPVEVVDRYDHTAQE
jgi:lipoprotein-anchoring transpeptidase ErfK/SrfK